MNILNGKIYRMKAIKVSSCINPNFLRKIYNMTMKKLKVHPIDWSLIMNQYEFLEQIRQLSKMNIRTSSTSSPTKYYDASPSSYQEPEKDEQGTLYGYKVLRVSNNRKILVSPVFPVLWNFDGSLHSDKVPTEGNGNGIHCLKNVNNYGLIEYAKGYRAHVLVRCALGGIVIEGEIGFRAEFAIIVGVYSRGHWKSYQDSQECAFRDADCFAKEKTSPFSKWSSDY